jgi:hypothetical protein
MSQELSNTPPLTKDMKQLFIMHLYPCFTVRVTLGSSVMCAVLRSAVLVAILPTCTVPLPHFSTPRLATHPCILLLNCPAAHICTCFVQSLQSHCIDTQFHWSSGPPVASHHEGPGFNPQGGYLCVTGILLLALSCYSVIHFAVPYFLIAHVFRCPFSCV